MTDPSKTNQELISEISDLKLIIEKLGKSEAKRTRAEEALRESEERYRLAINATKEGLWEMDLQTNQGFFSPRWCEIIGYSFDDPELPHTFDAWASRIHPDDYERVINVRNSHIEHGTEYDVDYRHRHKSGAYRWQKSRGQMVLDNESGKPSKIVGCISDINERKQAEETIRVDEAKYRTLVEHIPQKIFMKDRNSVYLSISDNFARDLGIPPEEVVGKADYDLYPNKLADKYREDDVRIMETGKTEEIEEKYLQEGKEVWVKTTKTPVKDESGEIIGLLGIFSDISKRKQAEEALKETLNQLESRVRERTIELEETNTALRVLLKRGGKDQKKVEENLQSNINQLVKPFLSKLRVSQTNQECLTYLNILEENLNNIVSPFINQLSATYKNLTPKEIQIAELIKQGKRSKEIAELFGISVGTVITHRNNIRKKLDLKSRDANLRSHLLSLV